MAPALQVLEKSSTLNPGLLLAVSANGLAAESYR